MTGIHPCDAEYDRSTQEIKWQDRCAVTDAFAAVLTQMLKPIPIDSARLWLATAVRCR